MEQLRGGSSVLNVSTALFSIGGFNKMYILLCEGQETKMVLFQSMGRQRVGQDLAAEQQQRHILLLWLETSFK